MMMPLSCPSPRLLSVTGFALSTLFATAHGQSSDSVRFEIASPNRVTDAGVIPAFSELYALPFETGINNEPSDYWILRNVKSFGFDVEEGTPQDEDEDEDDGELNIAYRYLVRYEAVNSTTRRVSERGVLGWRFASEDGQPASQLTTIGFIRAPQSQRPSQLPAEPIVGHFTNAYGEITWDSKSVRRNADLTLTGAAYDPDARFDDYITLNHNAAGVTVGDIQFVVPDTLPLKLWQFSANVPRRITDGVYVDVLQRSDALTSKDIPDSLITDDPQAFWERNYYFILRDERDSDRDGVPDYADLTGSVPTYPWYADYDWGNNWFYISWMNTAVYSDRRISGLWDYNLTLGWNYVPYTSDRNAFWTYVHSGNLGWMFTAESWYPTYFRHSDGVYLYQTVPPGEPTGVAKFYNYTTGETETVPFQ